MDQDQTEIMTLNDWNSAEIEEPAGAAVGEAFNSHEGSKEAHSGSELQNLNHTSDAQEVQAGESEMTYVGRRIRTLAKVKGLEPTEINLWKVAFEFFSERQTTLQNLIHKRQEKKRSVKTEILQVVGFFSAFQCLLITTVAHSNRLTCKLIVPMLEPSLFATVAAVVAILQKIRAMEKLRLATKSDKHHMEEYGQWLYDLEASGTNFHFDSLHHSATPIRHSRKWWKEFSPCDVAWLVLSVITFGGLCIISMLRIVCNPGASLPTN